MYASLPLGVWLRPKGVFLRNDMLLRIAWPCVACQILVQAVARDIVGMVDVIPVLLPSLVLVPLWATPVHARVLRLLRGTRGWM